LIRAMRGVSFTMHPSCSARFLAPEFPSGYNSYFLSNIDMSMVGLVVPLSFG